MALISRTLLATLLVSTTALAGDIRTERVHFHKGANSATPIHCPLFVPPPLRH